MELEKQPLKTLLETIPPLAGEAILGASLSIGYFAQAHEGLHQKWTLVEEIQGIAPKMLPAEVRDYLARFLFTGDDVFKLVEVLSGGERGRLALACLALKGSNLLLLDEPTNHLDLQSQEILQSVLSNYGGTILLVSHDRYLIDALATQIWEVIPARHTLVQFDGTYSEYRLFKQQTNPPEIEKSTPASVPQRVASRNLSKSEHQKIERRITKLEEMIAQTESELRVLVTLLARPQIDPIKVQQDGLRYQKLQNHLEELMEQWTVENDLIRE
jgi:ATP-binding cassette subfamily F protein 3